VTVSLAKRVPVFIVYGTALTYENGDVHFSDDIYGHDASRDAGQGLSLPVNLVRNSINHVRGPEGKQEYYECNRHSCF
jgi:hypothetical protein